MRLALGLGAVLAALCVAVGLGLLGGRIAPHPERITVSGDTYTLTSSPSSPAEPGILVAGGVAGGAAISYLKFDVSLNRPSNDRGQLPG